MLTAFEAMSARPLALPTPKDDAAINAGIARDPDSYELGSDEFKQLRGVHHLEIAKKVQVTLRLDADVEQTFKASGAGWQSRANDALKSWLKHHTS